MVRLSGVWLLCRRIPGPGLGERSKMLCDTTFGHEYISLVYMTHASIEPRVIVGPG